MHHVNPKRRRAQVLRFIAYAVTLTLSVVTTIVLLFIALGYRLDRASGHVVQSGLLLVDTKPVAGRIYINNALKDEEAPGRFVLQAGLYDLAIKRDGYRDWAKQVAIKASGVREVNYPLLIPTTITPRSLVPIATPDLVSQSQNRKFILSYTNSALEMQLTELNPKEPKQTQLNIGGVLTRENGRIGSLKVIEWALNNKQVLISHTLPSGAVEFISLDVTKPSEAVNITRLHPGVVMTDIHYVGGDTKRIYGLSEGVLRRYSLEIGESEVVMQGITSYQPYSDDTILFTRVAASTLLEVGIFKDKVETIIENKLDPVTAPHLAYAKYDDHFYFVIAQSGGEKITVYKDPLKRPILARQLPLITISLAGGTQKVRFSDSSRFILAQHGNTFTTYDLEDLKQFTVTSEFTLADDATYEWIDGYHIAVTANDNVSYLLEYDGQNQQQILGVRPGSRLYFAPNFQHVYRLMDADTAVHLEVASMVVGEE